MGPLGWQNWVQFLKGFSEEERQEAMLYSDAEVSGSLLSGLGPYQVHNAMSAGREGARPALVLRMRFGLKIDPDMTKTSDASFHGGDVFQEIAALLSLALGTRCRSGGLTRLWIDDDPAGIPIEQDHHPPYLARPSRSKPLLPRMTRLVQVTEGLSLLQVYPSIGVEDANALVRAARLYQQAVWIADADPNLAWILLVSAVETAAGRWSTEKWSHLELLHKSWPELAKLVAPLEGTLRDAIAREVAPLSRSSWRFRSFMMEFAPGPPDERPPEPFQLDWTELPKHLASVYTYRSHALHTGKPFPEPMSDSPLFGSNEFPSEIPIGLSTYIHGATWIAKDLPMLLATFEHIVRGALQAWWASL